MFNVYAMHTIPLYCTRQGRSMLNFYRWIVTIKFMIYCAVFMPISNAFNPMNDQATLNITFNYSFVYKWWVIQPIESWTTQRAICHGNVCFWLTHIAMAMKHWNDSNVLLEI